jgi:hypothetical protein
MHFAPPCYHLSQLKVRSSFPLPSLIKKISFFNPSCLMAYMYNLTRKEDKYIKEKHPNGAEG